MSGSSGMGTFKGKGEFVTLDGTRVGLLLTGNGPPVLLVHGFGEFIETWAYSIDALSRHFTACGLDLPGHGLSEQPAEEYMLSYTVRFLARFLEMLGIGRSMGRAICLGLASEYPDLVDRMVPVSSGGFSDRVPLPYRFVMLPVLGYLFLGPSVLVSETTVRIAMRRQFYDPDSPPREWIRVASHYFRMPRRNATIRNIARANASLTSSRPRAEVLDRLPLVKTPTLLIHGIQDHLVPVEQARAAAGVIGGAELKLFDGCGHNPQIERAAEFSRTVVSFLRLKFYSAQS